MAGDRNGMVFGRTEPERSTRFRPEILFTISADMTIACNSTRQGRLWFRACGFNMTSLLRGTIMK